MKLMDGCILQPYPTFLIEFDEELFEFEFELVKIIWDEKPLNYFWVIFAPIITFLIESRYLLQCFSFCGQS